jgi:hypothetical protein
MSCGAKKVVPPAASVPLRKVRRAKTASLGLVVLLEEFMVFGESGYRYEW